MTSFVSFSFAMASWAILVAIFGTLAHSFVPIRYERAYLSYELNQASVVEPETLPSADPTGDLDCFQLVAARAALCLIASEKKRNAVGRDATSAGSSATNWVDDPTAYSLQAALNLVEASKGGWWWRWFKSTPAPGIVDLTDHFASAVNDTLQEYDEDAWWSDQRPQFLSRVACRLLFLPSGVGLSQPLEEPPATLNFGRLLYGGVTRSRLLQQAGKVPRVVGGRTEVYSEDVSSWIMYGGLQRQYEAVDMGPAALLEVVLLPFGKEWSQNSQLMTIKGMKWKPSDMFQYRVEKDDSSKKVDEQPINGDSTLPTSVLSGKERNKAFETDFRSQVGGLQTQIDAIVRRVLDGRIMRPAEDDERMEKDAISQQLSMASMEAQELALLGLTPVRGLLLYGPPGCGKTALAREIARALKARAPKIVSAPELLDRWVGGSEKLVRALFSDAEAELANCQGDSTKSALHVVVIDEIDAVFRKRSSSDESGEATRSSVVNQILSKLDGVNAIPNVLLIGMTNRRELLDDALLRPGRLEVQIEIPLPDSDGRREILDIHFGSLRDNGRLSLPLCAALDGVRLDNSSIPVTDNEASVRKRDRIRSIMLQRRLIGRPYDLAADYATGGFSGADIAGLVRCAGSLALSRARKEGSGVDGLLITLDDVKQALKEIKG